MKNSLKLFKSFVTGSVLFCVVCLICSCSKVDPALVGKWQVKGETNEVNDITEFRADGTFNMGEEMKGKYKAIGKDKIRLRIDGPIGKMVGPIDCKIVVTGDTLSMTVPDEEPDILVRVK